MKPEVSAILNRVRDTSDFGYVPFTDINDTNSFGDNALHCLAQWGDCDSAKTLIAEGININQHGEHGYTPLHQAAASGHHDFVRLLLDSGADIHARTEGDLPFTIARLHSHDSICDLLSSYSATSQPDAQSEQRNTHLSHIQNQIEELEKRIKRECPDKV